MLAKPIRHFRMTIVLIAAHTTGDLSIDNDGLVDSIRVGQYSMPMHQEGLPVGWVVGGEGCHRLSVGIQLIGEEDREVGFQHIAKRKITAHTVHSIWWGGNLS